MCISIHNTALEFQEMHNTHLSSHLHEVVHDLPCEVQIRNACRSLLSHRRAVVHQKHNDSHPCLVSQKSIASLAVCLFAEMNELRGKRRKFWLYSTKRSDSQGLFNFFPEILAPWKHIIRYEPVLSVQKVDVTSLCLMKDV